MYFCHVNYNESATTELPSVHNGQAATARRNKKIFAMLTIKQITDDKETVIRGLEKKHFAGAREAIEKVLEFDNKRKAAQSELDSLLSEVKNISKSIGMLMKEGKRKRQRLPKPVWLKLKSRLLCSKKT